MGTATLTEWDYSKGNVGAPADFSDALKMTVDFDPQSVEVTYTANGTSSASNNTATGTLSKTAAQQTSQSATMSLTLIFDSTKESTSVQDKTAPLIELTKPSKPDRIGPDGAAPARPVVCFQWGSFAFIGNVTTITETIDFFSDDGKPLRSSLRLSLNEVAPPPAASAAGSGANTGTGVGFGAGVGISASASVGASVGISAGVSASASIGTSPLTLSQSGDTIQQIAARAGGSGSWKAVAAANGIDNPRLLAPGTVLNVNARVGISAT